MTTTAPPFAPFPEVVLRDRLLLEEWQACIANWVSVTLVHLSYSEDKLSRISGKDESLTGFLITFMRETATSGFAILGTSSLASALIRQTFLLSSGLLRLSSTPSALLQWEFLSDFSNAYGKKRTSPLVAAVFKKPGETPEASLHALKKSLIISLDSGIRGDLRIPELRLKKLNHLLHASPDTAAFFLAGSDFLDGLISCYKIMNPPLRKTIITTAYLCLVGLTEGDSPKYSMLTDQLYSLKAAADAHKAGPTNANDSMVAELVTSSPILKQVHHRLEQSGSTETRMKLVITALEEFRKPGAKTRPKKLIKRKIDKGKGAMQPEGEEELGQMRVHRMSQISQIQDLFPDLGSGFISTLLDEYQENTEQVIANLLEDSLPSHLANADRKKELSPERTRTRRRSSLAPRSTPTQVPIRHNVFDDDDFDKLTVDVGNLHFGKHNPGRTADDILKDRSTAPNKAAILSALSAFDADDDERDDTYDAADAGLAVNDAHADEADDPTEEILFKAYQVDPELFNRSSDTRRGAYRMKLKQDTGMMDEAIEGWALMLNRNPQRITSLEMKYSGFKGKQPALASSAWRESPADSGAEGSAPDGTESGTRGGPRGRGRGRGRGGGRSRGGNVAGPTGDQATENARRNKEANKGSRANHNRRDQRARKMARGGLPG